MAWQTLFATSFDAFGPLFLESMASPHAGGRAGAGPKPGAFLQTQMRLSLSPSRPLSLSPSLPLALSPSLPLSLSPSLPLSLSPSLPLSLSPSLPDML